MAYGRSMYTRILGGVVISCILLVASLYAFRSATPDAVQSAAASASGSPTAVMDCGIEKYVFGAGYDAQKRECVWSAFTAGTPAKFATVHHATEGALLTYTVVVTGRSHVEVTFENAAPGANGGTFHYSCTSLERRPINDQPNRMSLAATECSGRGFEVVF